MQFFETSDCSLCWSINGCFSENSTIDGNARNSIHVLEHRQKTKGFNEEFVKKDTIRNGSQKVSTKSHGKQMKKKDDFALNWVYDDHIKNSTDVIHKVWSKSNKYHASKITLQKLILPDKS